MVAFSEFPSADSGDLSGMLGDIDSSAGELSMTSVAELFILMGLWIFLFDADN